ncbi:MAG: extracellular solute-binding protein [Nitrospirae bacterium]|nr:MAG: extracellular solute-binding protein [Nitrospirota bacterium]
MSIRHRKETRKVGKLAWVFVGLLWGLGFTVISHAADTLVVYSGRAERLIQPVLDVFQQRTGITVQVLTASSTALVNRLQLEGPRTPADVLLTNDAGTLERAHELGLLQPFPSPEIEHAIPATFRAPDNSWIGLSGRIWVVVYNTELVNPTSIHSILNLADPVWKGKIAIPNAGSVYLQTGISVIRAVKGEAVTAQFLQGLKANAGTFVYGKNRQIVDAVARGEVALGLVNHYYIYRHLAKHPNAPIALLLTDQGKNGMGVVLNAAGIGITAYAKHREEARKLVLFLISRDGQALFARLNKEYPLRPDVAADPALPPKHLVQVAHVPLIQLAELREPTMTLIERIGLR